MKKDILVAELKHCDGDLCANKLHLFRIPPYQQIPDGYKTVYFVGSRRIGYQEPLYEGTFLRPRFWDVKRLVVRTSKRKKVKEKFSFFQCPKRTTCKCVDCSKTSTCVNNKSCGIDNETKISNKCRSTR